MRLTNAESGTHTGESAEAHAVGTPAGGAVAGPASGASGEDAADASDDDARGSLDTGFGVEAPHPVRTTKTTGMRRFTTPRIHAERLTPIRCR
jgi:hypothetical protein